MLYEAVWETPEFPHAFLQKKQLINLFLRIIKNTFYRLKSEFVLRCSDNFLESLKRQLIILFLRFQPNVLITHAKFADSCDIKR